MQQKLPYQGVLEPNISKKLDILRVREKIEKNFTYESSKRHIAIFTTISIPLIFKINLALVLQIFIGKIHH
jgi:hypothetical protein